MTRLPLGGDLADLLSMRRDAAVRNARERILDILLPDSRRPAARPAFVGPTAVEEEGPTETREKLGRWLDTLYMQLGLTDS